MMKKKPRSPVTARKNSKPRSIRKPAKSVGNLGPEDEVDGYTRVDVYDPRTIDRIGSHYADILEQVGEDPTREGLLKTPERVAKALQYLTHGYDLDPSAILKSALFKETYSQMVLVKDIEVYSLCEHHMLPFFGKAHVAYIPNGRITGLSKIPRVVDAFARRLQVQERLTNQIRDCIHEALRPLGVAVVIEADHLCMRMRGVQKQNSVTTTSRSSLPLLGSLLTVSTTGCPANPCMAAHGSRSIVNGTRLMIESPAITGLRNFGVSSIRKMPRRRVRPAFSTRPSAMHSTSRPGAMRPP